MCCKVSSSILICLSDSSRHDLDVLHRAVFCTSLDNSQSLYYPHSTFDAAKDGVLAVEPDLLATLFVDVGIGRVPTRAWVLT